MFDTDVLIIGAGPAGCSAAIMCALSQMKVTIIETEECLRQRPGESLHPGIEPLLKKLGIMDQFMSKKYLTYDGNWVKWRNNIYDFISFGEDSSGRWKGFQVYRPSFDEIFLERVHSLKVNVIRPCRATSLIISNDCVNGVITNKGTFRSSIVIDSSGGIHWLARRRGLKINRYSPPLISYYGYLQGECPSTDYAPAITADKKGWIWTAKIKPCTYQWIRLNFDNEKIHPHWIPDQYCGLTQNGTNRASDVTWRIVSETAGHGYFIVGDAAFVLDPISSHGIIKSIMSGMFVAYLISKLFKNFIDEEEAIRIYNSWILSWFSNDVSILRYLYKMHANPPAWINNP